MTAVAPSLEAELLALASTPRLLVALDFDGTIAPLALRPCEVVPDPTVLEAVVALAALERTTVAVISARSRSELRAHSGVGTGVRLLGSYGVEVDGPPALSSVEHRRRAEIVRRFDRVRRDHGGWIERKPLGAAFHARGEHDPAALLAEAASAAAEVAGTQVTIGHEVVEGLVRPVSKATALTMLAESLGSTFVVYAGDDRADEAVLAQTRPGLLGLHVGHGPTEARHLVDDPLSLGCTLRVLAALRRWALAAPRATDGTK